MAYKSRQYVPECQKDQTLAAALFINNFYFIPPKSRGDEHNFQGFCTKVQKFIADYKAETNPNLPIETTIVWTLLDYFNLEQINFVLGGGKGRELISTLFKASQKIKEGWLTPEQANKIVTEKSETSGLAVVWQKLSEELKISVPITRGS